MSDIIDIFSKKKITANKIVENSTKSLENNTDSYITRMDKCIAVYQETGKDCQCSYCKDKIRLANKLAEISRWLVLDNNQNSERKLQIGDWLEIVVLAKMQVENYILKS